MISDRASKAKEHPIIGALLESLGTIRTGLTEVITSSDSNSKEEDFYSDSNGPVNGPASTKETVRSPIVSFEIDSDGMALEAEIQFWMPEGGGGIFGAWHINGQEGDYGVFDRENRQFWFGSKPFWTANGDRRPYAELDDDSVEELWNAFTSLMAQHHNRSFGVLSEGVEDDEILEETPAPSMRSIGEPIDVPIVNDSSKIPARFQVWHPESSGTAYVAWQIGDQSGRYGIVHAAGLWLGNDEQFEAPNGMTTPFIYIGDENVQAKLEQHITEVRESEGGESVEIVSDVDVEYASSPHSPGNNHPWDDKQFKNEDI